MPLVRRLGLAICAVLILAGSASIDRTTAGANYLALSLLALTSFGLTLADGSDMGFVFVILARPPASLDRRDAHGGAGAIFIQSVIPEQSGNRLRCCSEGSRPPASP